MTAVLLDQGLPYSTAKLLRERGIDAIHVADLGMGEASDAEILRRSRELSRAVCTLDGDFHALMALSDAVRPSVVLVRVQHLRAPAMAELLARVMARTRAAIDEGALITVSRSGVRLRRLPVRWHGTTQP